MYNQKYLFLSIVSTLVFIGTLSNVGYTDLIVRLEFENSFNDTSGNGINGTSMGNAKTVFDAARNSNVLSLDGADDAVSLNSADFIAKGFDLFDEITIAMWVYTNVDISATAFSGGLNTNWAPGGVHVKMNNGHVNVGINGGSGDVNGTTVIPVGEWHHIAFTASALDFIVAVYYDGVEEGIQAPTTFPAFLDFSLNPVIGAWNNGGDIQREWNGMKDDIRIYNNALTPEEIQALVAEAPPAGVDEWALY